MRCSRPSARFAYGGVQALLQATQARSVVYTRAGKKLGKRNASRQEREDLALETLNRYAVIGRQHNDDWLPDYMDRVLQGYAER